MINRLANSRQISCFYHVWRQSAYFASFGRQIMPDGKELNEQHAYSLQSHMLTKNVISYSTMAQIIFIVLIFFHCSEFLNEIQSGIGFICFQSCSIHASNSKSIIHQHILFTNLNDFITIVFTFDK